MVFKSWKDVYKSLKGLEEIYEQNRIKSTLLLTINFKFWNFILYLLSEQLEFFDELLLER